MILKKWNDLPDPIKNNEVKPYYDILKSKSLYLVFKRIFDMMFGFLLLLFLAIPMVLISIIIKLDSEGPVFYRQERITTYGKPFKIHKFRTMVIDADKIGSSITTHNDCRITKVGATLRKYRLDEFPQVFDLISGNMSFVGTRPEVLKYVEKYKPEYMATLLLPAGITSEASIRFKDESILFDDTDDIDSAYIDYILPRKMEYNLAHIKNFSFCSEMKTIFKTVFAVLGKDYE